MNIHKNARLTPHSRAALVRRVLDEGQTPKAVATAFGVCERTVRKRDSRFQAEGAAGLAERPARRLARGRRPGPVVPERRRHDDHSAPHCPASRRRRRRDQPEIARESRWS